MIPVEFNQALITRHGIKPSVAQLITTVYAVMYNQLLLGRGVKESAFYASSPYAATGDAKLVQKISSVLTVVWGECNLSASFSQIGVSERFRRDAMSLDWAAIIPEAVIAHQEEPDHHYLIAA